MVYKPYFYICLFLSFSLPVQALSPFVMAKEELFQLGQQAQRNNRASQKGERFSALVAHILDPNQYVHAKEHLSDDQFAVLIQAARQVDNAMSLIDPTQRAQEIASGVRTFNQVVGSISHQSFGSPQKVARVSSKRAKSVGAASAQAPSHPLPHADEEELFRRMMMRDDVQDNNRGFMSYLSENKWNILFGIAALYTLYARANDLPPFDLPEEGNAPQEDNAAAPEAAAHENAAGDAQPAGNSFWDTMRNWFSRSAA